MATTEDASQGKQSHLLHNICEKFKSRLSRVEIESIPAIMLQDMEGSSLGVRGSTRRKQPRLLHNKSNITVRTDRLVVFVVVRKVRKSNNGLPVAKGVFKPVLIYYL
jgi:hypothetical protein